MFIYYSQEGSSYDRGLYARCFEELFDLANLDTTSTSQYKFCVTVCELYNEQVCFCFHLPNAPFCFVSWLHPWSWFTLDYEDVHIVSFYVLSDKGSTFGIREKHA